MSALDEKRGSHGDTPEIPVMTAAPHIFSLPQKVVYFEPTALFPSKNYRGLIWGYKMTLLRIIS